MRPGAHHQRRWDDGRTLLKAPLGDAVIKAFGFPHYQSHRADVLSMLIAAFPAERLHIGHRLIAFTDRGDCVNAEFENGKRITTDALIGADGIHSTVRELLFGGRIRTLRVAWPIGGSYRWSASNTLMLK